MNVPKGVHDDLPPPRSEKYPNYSRFYRFLIDESDQGDGESVMGGGRLTCNLAFREWTSDRCCRIQVTVRNEARLSWLFPVWDPLQPRIEWEGNERGNVAKSSHTTVVMPPDRLGLSWAWTGDDLDRGQHAYIGMVKRVAAGSAWQFPAQVCFPPEHEDSVTRTDHTTPPFDLAAVGDYMGKVKSLDLGKQVWLRAQLPFIPEKDHTETLKSVERVALRSDLCFSNWLHIVRRDDAVR